MSTSSRGYGSAHRRLRRQWARRIAAGDVTWARGRRARRGRCGTILGGIEVDARWLNELDDEITGWRAEIHFRRLAERLSR